MEDDEMEWCPVFHPTKTEFSSFAQYIRTVVEPQCAHIGICKIVPPQGWFIRSYDLETLECGVSRPVSQHVAGKKGIFNVDLVERKSMSAPEFYKLTQQLGGENAPTEDDIDAIERQFWKGLRPTMEAPVYGADITASLFGDAEACSWNLNHLETILSRIDLPGITRSMLYFGMWRAMFAFHTEDMNLYSINYIHHGASKFWYGIPPSAASQLERAAQAMFPEKHHACQQFMRHKTSLISPSRLDEFDIPYYKAYQKEGEFVITFPSTYHQGFNLGFNIAEAVNFATMRWISHGLKAKVCKCSPDSVRIDMDTFLPKLFEDEEQNKNVLGEDPWLFACRCGKAVCSDESEGDVDEEWFECSSCQIWLHLRCIYPELVHRTGELPESLLCHRCGGGSTLSSPNATPKSGRRRRRTSSNASLKNPSSVLPSPKKSKILSTDPPRSIPKEKVKRRDLLQKNSTLHFEDTQGKVAAVDGEYIRVHYKGCSVDEDEWVKAGSKELKERLIKVTPPPTKHGGRASTVMHLPDTWKNASIGEYDLDTGLVHLTLQRGKLLFRMGTHDSKAATKSLQTGSYKNQSLYLEEALYLMRRRALAVCILGSDRIVTAEELRASVSDGRESTARIVAYDWFKSHQLHPKRSDVLHDAVVMDVEALQTQTIYDDVQGKSRKRKVKRWARAFTVFVFNGYDSYPGPRELRRMVETVDGPAKVAVVYPDESVLVYQVKA